MIFTIVGLPREEVHVFHSVQELVDGAKALGWEVKGQKTSLKVVEGPISLPTFEGLVGPMNNGVNDDGATVIRYETEKAYDLYSH